MSQIPSDEELVERAKAAGSEGERTAFDNLVERYQSRVVANCRYLSRSSSDADDLAQEVFIKAFFGLPRFEGRSSFKTWLFAVIRNTAADQRRRRLRLVQRHRRVLAGPAQPSADAALEQSQQQQVVRQALATLSDRQREVLHLVLYHDLTIEPAAHVLGLSVGSARTHYNRGKQRLRERLEATSAFDPSSYER